MMGRCWVVVEVKVNMKCRSWVLDEVKVKVDMGMKEMLVEWYLGVVKSLEWLWVWNKLEE
jgi:hypothetical protein